TYIYPSTRVGGEAPVVPGSKKAKAQPTPRPPTAMEREREKAAAREKERLIQEEVLRARESLARDQEREKERERARERAKAAAVHTPTNRRPPPVSGRVPSSRVPSSRVPNSSRVSHATPTRRTTTGGYNAPSSARRAPGSTRTRGPKPLDGHWKELEEMGIDRTIIEVLSQNDDVKPIDPKILKCVLGDLVPAGHSTVKFGDIAGLRGVKETLYELVILPQQRPDLFTNLRQPAKGLLLFGPPGNGKTLVAKAVAAESQVTFISISASSVFSRFLGESSQTVRAIFAVARALQPCIVFIDEIDSILSKRSDSDHEASRRVKTEFLVQMDGVKGSSADRILIMGATNIPDCLDDAALRRFPKRVLIPLPDLETRMELVSHLVRDSRHSMSAKELRYLGELTQGYSGSDLNALTREAAMGPLRSIPRSKVLQVDLKSVRPMNLGDFKKALQVIKPTLANTSLGELHKWAAEHGSTDM
ncbi:hypothetical protein KIPB_003835, partial [Kipferlia bialata]